MMSRFFKPVALFAALAMAATVATTGAAEAGSKHRDRAIVAGAVGVAAGVILGTALSQPSYGAPAYGYIQPDPVYVEPVHPYYGYGSYHRPRSRVIYHQPAPVYETHVHYHNPAPVGPVYDYRPAPWTPEWYRYCASKYRSFHADSGTFQPYHGPRQLCQ